MFFREPHILATLAEQALARRIRAASASDPLRVWVPACGAGEEVYTIAICLLEQFEVARRTPHLTIFATDTDDEALALTRAGRYAHRTLQELSPVHLASYFEPAGGEHVRVRPAVRALLSIAPHDVLRDPPIFSHLDLIDGRNLPAQLSRQSAQRFAASAHFALREAGWLLLATESDARARLEQFTPFAIGLPLYGKQLASAPCAPERGHPVAHAGTESDAAQAHACELRSLREECAVLRVELQHTVRALDASDRDLTRLIDMLEVAAVFLDPDQRIRRYAGSAEDVLGIAAGDLGRPLAAFSSPLIDTPLLDAVHRAVATGTAAHKEIHCENQHWYLRRIQPHATTDPPDGVLITWVDITPVKALQEEVARIAALEQQRIGQELHDGIQQELAALGLFAGNLLDALAKAGMPQEQQWATRLSDGVAALSRHVRALARGLVPRPVEADSLAPALAELARDTTDSSEVTCEFTLDGEVRLSDADCATHLYRIAQEAVRNALQHGRAERITIRLAGQGEAVRLEVSDNGLGLAPRSGVGRGAGLRLMEHRCSLIGGTFTAQGAPRGGTRVVCTLGTADAREQASG